MQFLGNLIFPGGFMPHGNCYLWTPSLIGLHVVSDSLIALSYLSIPITLVHFARKRRDIPFSWMFLCFGAFIVACGGTHLMEVWTIWFPSYWLAGALKAVTACFSVVTAVLLIRVTPRALALPGTQWLLEINRKLTGKSNKERKRSPAYAASAKTWKSASPNARRRSWPPINRSGKVNCAIGLWLSMRPRPSLCSTWTRGASMTRIKCGAIVWDEPRGVASRRARGSQPAIPAGWKAFLGSGGRRNWIRSLRHVIASV